MVVIFKSLQKAVEIIRVRCIITDGSRSEEGVMGGGHFFSHGTLGIRADRYATVRDGETAGL